ncbi:MAG: UDP-N-acetylmuramate--L-alanine ligase [candidate division WS2 bacterium ADurb.Bin280]|uniref:UDP-N-acetylglucosamine--N-acetylmuramyl-(pentapeptide) pyrophosphoryl-undecaprenol N-acetylglucosamine transferase n=1 Tax=candidate division WS2 bacterium ADurb.Bin280 TaxID=1852829 RepID=A0A1V5SGH6_9BACT|nr:MAG: UDP-N-acetylmuramate--L-alanine ligase [candidate division WS2 bacterium ADurb.Bin280]
MKNKKIKIILAGGGTAGHIYPVLEVAKILKKDKKIEMVFFGSGKSFEKSVVAKARIPYQKIFSGKLRRNGGFFVKVRNIFDFFMVAVGLIQAIIYLSLDRPSIIFSKGGFASLPTVLAGAFLKIPIIIHESDIVMGLANKIASKFATSIALAFDINNYPPNIRRKAFYAGLPLSKQFFEKNSNTGRGVLIFGGSQGASSLNKLVFESIKELLEIGPVVHLTGENDFDQAIKIRSQLSSKSNLYEVYKFSHQMSDLISKSKLVVCRAGAGSIFEVLAMKKNLLLVPISKDVASHQQYNANFFEKRALAEVFDQSEGAEKFIKAVNKAYERENSKMKLNFAFPASSELLSQEILAQVSYQNFKKRYKKIFLIGIGGVSMSAIAAILRKMRKRVTGSDLKSGGHKKTNINKSIDLVVYSSAADKKSKAAVEHERAHRLKIPVIKRSQMIARLTQSRSVIAISGMHGKTTTSALISGAMNYSGYDPGIMIGAPNGKKVNTASLGKDRFFVLEACEYDGSFLDFHPTVAVITNIEEEHLDYFRGGIKQIKHEFELFIKNIKPGGLLVYCCDDVNTENIVSDCGEFLNQNNIRVMAYGFSPKSNIVIRDYAPSQGGASFKFVYENEEFEISSRVAGKHFAKNCAASFAVSLFLGLQRDRFSAFINDFSGVKGRFEFYGKFKGASFYYDYGHHPTELKSIFEASRDISSAGKKFFIFEPHQQDRFNNFYEDFFEEIAKSRFDVIGILPVYAVAGRDARAKFTSRDLVDRLEKRGKLAFYLEGYKEAVDLLKSNVRSGDFVLICGATNVHVVASALTKSKKQ